MSMPINQHSRRIVTQHKDDDRRGNNKQPSLAPAKTGPRHLTSMIKYAPGPGAERVLKLHKNHGSDFNHIHLSAMWSRLKRERAWIRRNPSQLEPVRRTTLRLIKQYEHTGTLKKVAREVANVAYGLAKSGVGSRNQWSALWTLLASVMQEQAREHSPQQIANTAWAFATVGHTAPPLFDVLAQEVAKRASTFNPQEIANTVWAFATIGHAAPTMFDALAREAAKQASALNPQNIANTTWAFATAGHTSPPLFDALAREAAKQASTFKPQEIANTAWSFATIGHEAPLTMFDALARAAAKQVSAFKPQGIANTAWAFATVGHTAPPLFDALARGAAMKAPTFKPQELANTVWAFATIGHEAKAMFDSLALEVAKQASALNPQGIANIAWAFASKGYEAPTMFDALAREAAKQAPAFNPQGIANTVWAFASKGYEAPTMFDALAREAIKQAPAFNPQGIANTVWAFASMGYEAPAMLDALARVVAKQAPTFNPQGIANTAWAFASMGHEAPKMFDALAHEAIKQAPTFIQQNIANTAWAFASVSHSNPADHALSVVLADRLVAIHAGNKQRFDVTSLCQLHLWVLWHQEHRLPSPLPASLTEQCGSAFRSRARHVHRSRLQSEVCSTLCGLSEGHAPSEEVLTEQGYTLDAVVRWKGTDVGVEVDGPSHFLECSQRPTGATILKRRLLRSFGWTLVSIPYWEWDAIRFTQRPAMRTSTQAEAAARKYLGEALDNAVAP